MIFGCLILELSQLFALRFFFLPLFVALVVDVVALHDADFLDIEGLGRGVVGGVVHLDLEGSCEQIGLDDQPLAQRGLDDGADLGRALDQVGVSLLLIFQTAHQSSAGARDLGGGEG